ncbi:putative plant self-incompatibility response [Arabidopsis thaliana]
MSLLQYSWLLVSYSPFSQATFHKWFVWNDGAQQCLNNLFSTWDPSVRLSPISCNCTPQLNNHILCSCPI